MKVTRKAASPIMFVILGMLFSIPIHAQNVGRISGTVADQSGAVVAGTKVLAINTETGVKTQTISNDAGNYNIPALLPGRYRVEAEMQGFKKYVREPVLISTATPVGLNIPMEVGEVTTEVSVTGAAPLLQTQEIGLSAVVENKMIRDLPIALNRDQSIASGRRQPTAFIFLTPGVSGNAFGKTVNGMQQRSTEVQADGGLVGTNAVFGQQGNATPPFDAVGEFKIITGVPEAEDGVGSSTIKLTLKSGTNMFHGSVNEYIRNDVFDSRGFFAKTRPVVRQNEYGYAVGGPVFIPKVYNGKDKTFFYHTWGGFKVRGGGTSRTRTFPTEAFKKGDFSKLTDRAGKLIPIFDPLSAPQDGKSARTQFPGNIIPANRIYKGALKAAQLMPTAQIDRAFDNFVGELSRSLDDGFWSLKIDHNFNQHHKLSGSYWKDDYKINQFQPVPGPTSDGYRILENGGGLKLNYNWIISPSLVNEFRPGWGRDVRGSGLLPGASLGPAGSNPLDIKNLPWPEGSFYIGAEGYSRGPGASGFQYATGEGTGASITDTYQASDSLTWLKSNHTFKIGVDYRQNKAVSKGPGNAFAEFRKFQTSDPASPNFGAWGDGLASVLLGDVYEQFYQNQPGRSGYVGKRGSWFAQDSWKVSPKLSVTVGIRHDIVPVGVIENGSSNFDPQRPNSGAAGMPGALAFFPSGRFLDVFKKQFGPRLGFAYSLNDKTVLRVGYGLLHQFSAGEGEGGVGSRQGYFSNLFFSPSGFPSVPVYNLWQDGAQVDKAAAKLPNTDPTQLNGKGVPWVHPSAVRSTRVQQWTLNLQRQLPRNIVVEARYVGWKAQGMFSTLDNINQLDPKYLSLGGLLTNNINSPEAQAAGIRLPYAGFNGSVAQALRRFPQYGRINPQAELLGQGQHHSLQLNIQNRLNKDLLFLANYVWAKTMSDQGLGGGFGTSGVDQFRHSLEKAVQVGQPPHELKATWVYELPVGKNKRALSNAPKVLNGIVGGWAVAGTQRYSKGTYLGVSGGNPLPIFADSVRPNRVIGEPVQIDVGGKFDPAKSLYLNSKAFVPNAPFTFGNAGRVLSDFRGFAYLNEDLNIIKRGGLGVTEDFKYELRVEIFNLFNRTVFANPGSNMNSPGTFGIVSSQANLPRQIQFGIKILW